MSGPEDQHPWDREDEEIRQAFAEKDAEITRLKALLSRAATALDNGDLAILEEMREASK